jgi:hypothetical protein
MDFGLVCSDFVRRTRSGVSLHLSHVDNINNGRNRDAVFRHQAYRVVMYIAFVPDFNMIISTSLRTVRVLKQVSVIIEIIIDASPKKLML